jgi:hypothetical protein
VHMREHQCRLLHAFNGVAITADIGGGSEIPTDIEAEDTILVVISAVSGDSDVDTWRK